MKKYVLLLFVFGVTDIIFAQVYPFGTDAYQRGYYNRPYQRYEAEDGWCLTNGLFLQATDDQTKLQSEASHQMALNLLDSSAYVSWVVDNAGDGLTIRFSLPDNAIGTGTQGTLLVLAGNDTVGVLDLNSYWAWQYCSGNYPTNDPNNGPLVRMRFDEKHLLLDRKIEKGETLTLLRNNNDSIAYTIDFVELELTPQPVSYEEVEGNKVMYDGSDLANFIAENGGKTIYIPQGTWNCGKRIKITKDNTHIVGAGMWYTQIYFDAPSDNLQTYSYRGIETNNSNLIFEGIYLNTINNQRYYNADESKQVGKAFMGSWGSNSIIRNCWAEHFECGAWIADYSAVGSHHLLIENCRFRNNYADGVNCSQASEDHIIRFCSFRNNGDDDMASWSTSRMCKNVTFEYCTAENNWRASSLGFFGGEGHQAHHLAIFDALECGMRINSDFSGRGFSAQGTISITDISIYHCGCRNGSRGTAGDFWGHMQGAVNVGNTNYYDIHNLYLQRIEIVDSRQYAMYLRAGAGGHKVYHLSLMDILIDGADYGIYFSGLVGSAEYCNLTFTNCNQDMNTPSSSLEWKEGGDCVTAIQPVDNSNDGLTSSMCEVYNALGNRVYCGLISGLRVREGFYIVKSNDDTKKIMIW